MKRNYQSLITSYLPKDVDLNTCFQDLSLHRQKRTRHPSSIVFDQFRSCIPVIQTTFHENVIYRHPNLRVVYQTDKDSYGVYAEDKINIGEIIVFERAIVDTHSNLELYVEQNPDIANQLYPRNSKLTCHEIRDKIDYNVWDWYDKKEGDPIELKRCSALFTLLSKFNHSCDPNAFVIREVLNSDIDQYDGYFALMCVRPISAGDEICLTYGIDSGHESTHFNWFCTCWRDEETRRTLFEEAYNRAEESWKKIANEFLVSVDLL
jgi:hypothetical protein